jgi:hypothetical protein
MRGPIASPTASSGARDFSRKPGTFGQLSATKDLAPAGSSRITAHHLQQIANRLSEQDWQVLDFVSTSRLATGKQLVQCLWMADRHARPSQARIARRALKRLGDWRILDPLPGRSVGGLHGGSETMIYGVGAAGVRLLAMRDQHQARLGTPGARYVNHTLACTQFVVDLRTAAARGELDAIEIQQEPHCWRSFLAGIGSRVICKPDLFVRVAIPGSVNESHWMIEVDMATEASATVRFKALRHLAYYRSASEPVHPRVLWAVPDERRARQVAEIVRRLPPEAQRLFMVCLLDETIELLRGEHRS